VVVNERTTVAAGFALAQFISGRRISGRVPGPENAAGMARNLADPRSGGLSRVLRRPPNGNHTETLLTFNSLANMLAPCARKVRECGRLFRAAKPPDGAAPDGALDAIADIARNPWHNVRRLFRLARSGPQPYRRALGAGDRPAAWTLALRFVGDGETMDGPGNFAIDGEGNVWTANNYVYGADRLQPVCGSNLVLKFDPRGRYVPGSPYEGGGLNGAGYGITLDPDGNVWVGNFGFAAPAPGCSAQPPHNSVSQFSPDGEALSPDATPISGGGFTEGSISWPQGTVSDRDGNIWIANCGNDSVTMYPGGDQRLAQNFLAPSPGEAAEFSKPFDIAFNLDGRAFVTANRSSNVAILNPDGTQAPGSPITSGGLNRPMGIAADSEGNMWVANSGVIDVPCPGPVQVGSVGGTITLIGADGTTVAGPFSGGGLTIPWGISVDGDDNVWVSNFARRRLSQFCGTNPANCPPGKDTGDPISPRRGYSFDGMTRSTAVEIDPSGNAWVTNNWKLIPIQANPGGYEVVIYVGVAAPVKTPLIGPPVGL
jgi:streptogramin lyase